MPRTESLELAPRMKNRATAAITVVMAEQEGQEKKKCKDRLLKNRSQAWDKQVITVKGQI